MEGVKMIEYLYKKLTGYGYKAIIKSDPFLYIQVLAVDDRKENAIRHICKKYGIKTERKKNILYILEG